MKATWKTRRGINPKPLLDKFREIVTVRDDGRLSFESFQYHELTATIHSIIKFKASIVWSVRRKAVSYAIRETLRGRGDDPSQFLKHLNENLDEQLSRKNEQYHLLTSLSLSGARVLPTLDIFGTKLRMIGNMFPKKYADREIQEHEFQLPIKPTPHNYQKVIASTQARHPHEATEKAIDAIDIYRAICCLLINPRMQIKFGPKQEPINRVVLGGMHSLHVKSGKLVNLNEYWYEPYPATPKPFNIADERAQNLRTNIKALIGRFSECSYVDRIKDALLRYVRALDEWDPNKAALRLWGALEVLCMEPNENYDALVQRCSFVVLESYFHAQNLEALREYRNDSVHYGAQSEEALTYCFQMQYYFYCLIVFHFNHCMDFRSIEEVNKFLSLSPNVRELERKRRLLDDAIKFRTM